MPWTKIYTNKVEFEKAAEGTKLRGLTYREAILEATVQAMEGDPDVFVIGQGVDDCGAVFGTTKGLAEKFGPARVMDAPLAENGITGIAAGAAIAGMRPLLVHMRVDFLLLSMDQLVNHASKWHYMFGGAASVPLTIRAITGRGWGSAAQHSQALHALFAHIPGLKVVMPASPYDAKGLLSSAIYDNNPVLFLEHRWLYEHTGHVPAERYFVPIGEAVIRRAGKDLTIAAVSHMVSETLAASSTLAERGIDAEVIDLRSLKPLDAGLVVESVKKTGRLLIADTGWKEYGIGAEIAARVFERAFSSLKAPVERIALPDAPTPASHVLEGAYYPGKDDIIKAAERAFRYGLE